jgi:hypothetical protein
VEREHKKKGSEEEEREREGVRYLGNSVASNKLTRLKHQSYRYN